MIRYVSSPLLSQAGVVHGWFERSGGNSRPPFDSLNIKLADSVPDTIDAVVQNRQLALAELGLDPERLLYLFCNKGSDQVIELKDVDGSLTIQDYDGAVTAKDGFAIGFGVADCAPVLLAEPKAGIIGVAHAGWKGSNGNIAGKVVKAMIKAGAQPEKIVAAIGPTICVNHYEVKQDVASKFDKDFVKEKDGKLWLDLVAANSNQLKAAGITQIDVLDICTFEHTDRFFSARKEGKTGRFLAVIGKK